MPTPVEQFLSAIAPAARIEHNDALLPERVAFPDQLQSNTMTALPYWTFLQISGPDSAKFLQGQLTCDIATATTAHATPGAHCSPKGRMLSSFLIAQRSDGAYWLRVRSDLAESASAALKKYMVFSKAALTEQTQLLGVGLHGPGAAAAVHAFAGSTPSGQFGVIQTAGGFCVQLDAEAQRFEAWLPLDEAEQLIRHCTGFVTVDSTFWRWLDIRAGMASIGAATTDIFIPQMLNYHLNGGVSFSKGCYTGQEIVARTQYRGQVKRHLLRAETAINTTNAASLSGSDVLGSDGRAVGQIIEAVNRGDDHCELLLVASGEESSLPPLYLANSENDPNGFGGELELRVL